LLANHTEPTHILTLVVAVNDHPMTANYLRGQLPRVGDANRIGEEVLLL
jgi:hypothetical protein